MLFELSRAFTSLCYSALLQIASPQILKRHLTPKPSTQHCRNNNKNKVHSTCYVFSRRSSSIDPGDASKLQSRPKILKPEPDALAIHRNPTPQNLQVALGYRVSPNPPTRNPEAACTLHAKLGGTFKQLFSSPIAVKGNLFENSLGGLESTTQDTLNQ